MNGIQPMFAERLRKLRHMLQMHDLEAVLFTDPSNIRYYCGFTGSDGVLLVAEASVTFLTDSRYTTQAQQEVAADRIIQYRSKNEGVADLLAASGGGTVGFEGDSVSYAAFEKLRASCPSEWVWHPLPDSFKELRGIKDACEIAIMKRAARIAGEALREILPDVRPGAVERDLALALEFAMRRRGAEGKSFPFIVASGERGALPHGQAADRRLQDGELVTFDFGARLEGYCSDETVTVAVGSVGQRLRDIYEIVYEAQQAALSLIKPGVPLKDLDEAARSHIRNSGYGDYFGHGLGHGVGLEVHEYPVVSSRSEDIAREGMVFTVEPGIYIPELGGVRLEDTVQVTAEGFERLTSIDKKFSSI